MALSLMWDDEIDRVVVEAHSVDPTAGDPSAVDPTEVEAADDDAAESEFAEIAAEGEPGDVLRVVLTGQAARAFVTRAQSVVSAGRPPCPFCGLPLDPDGHICPRQNGHRRH